VTMDVEVAFSVLDDTRSCWVGAQKGAVKKKKVKGIKLKRNGTSLFTRRTQRAVMQAPLASVQRVTLGSGGCGAVVVRGIRIVKAEDKQRVRELLAEEKKSSMDTN
jgi:hypothetical protein